MPETVAATRNVVKMMQVYLNRHLNRTACKGDIKQGSLLLVVLDLLNRPTCIKQAKNGKMSSSLLALQLLVCYKIFYQIMNILIRSQKSDNLKISTLHLLHCRTSFLLDLSGIIMPFTHVPVQLTFMNDTLLNTDSHGIQDLF